MESDIEKTNLEVHVELARKRYTDLETKVDRIDTKVHELEAVITQLRLDFVNGMAALREDIQSSNTATQRAMVGGVATVIGGVLSTIIILAFAMI